MIYNIEILIALISLFSICFYIKIWMLNPWWKSAVQYTASIIAASHTIRNKNNVHLYSLRNTFPYLTTIVFERHGNITMIRVSSFLFDGYDDKTSRQNSSDYVITGHPPSKAICLEQMREILSLNNKN